jgi:hypothetical protein
MCVDGVPAGRVSRAPEAARSFYARRLSVAAARRRRARAAFRAALRSELL